ncbi:MAG: class I SAM-dependent methyltransferase [Steroidobacteraceae bacterium]
MPALRSSNLAVSLQHWENYYRGGALVSCPLEPGSGYTQELRDIWVRFFSGLPAGSRILDIGTGNGAIALIALQTAAAAGRSYEIHGTDLAQIDPVRDVRDGARLFANVQFHPQVATEQLPFEASSFDAVSGQYALEYTAVDQSLREIHRVLKPDGRAQFVLHHADSIVAHKAHQTLQQSTMVLEETKVLRKLRRHLEAERRSPTAARKTWADVTEALGKLDQAAGQSDNPLMLNVTIDAVRKLLAARQHMSPASLNREIDRFEGNVRASVRRLQDLIRCGQTEIGMQGIAQLARAQGFMLLEMAAQFHAADNLVGWRLHLGKP